MQTKKVEVAIIGAGTAGMSAYRAATLHTDSVVLIESGVYGTTCARVGCMPSKLLIAAAEISHQIDNAEPFGLLVENKKIDGHKVMERVRNERDRFVGFVEDAVEAWPAEHKLIGEAVFTSDHELLVGDHTLVIAERIVIATGTSPAVPPHWYELDERLIVNDDVFDWQTLPESVAIVGTGVIGMELSQALARLGVRTHLFGIGNKFGPASDPVIIERIRKVMNQSQAVSADAQIVSVSNNGEAVEIVYIEDGEQSTEQFEYLLAATGRKPNLSKLKLEATTLQLDERGMPEFNVTTGQIADSHIFIAGDVSNAHPLLHEAADDGRIAGDNAARYPEVVARPRRAPLSIVFTDPQIAMAGSRYSELQQGGIDFAVGEASFDDQGRSRVIGKNNGVIRVYGEQGSGRFLGVEMIGPAAEHIGHLLSWSVQHNLTVQQMLDSPFYHPVIEEGVRTALRVLSHELKMGPVPVERCLDCGPGA